MILDRLAAAEHQLEALAGLNGGRLRVGAFPSANATLIPLAMAEFDRAHHEVCLNLVEARSPGARARCCAPASWTSPSCRTPRAS